MLKYFSNHWCSVFSSCCPFNFTRATLCLSWWNAALMTMVVTLPSQLMSTIWPMSVPRLWWNESSVILAEPKLGIDEHVGLKDLYELLIGDLILANLPVAVASIHHGIDCMTTEQFFPDFTWRTPIQLLATMVMWNGKHLNRYGRWKLSQVPLWSTSNSLIMFDQQICLTFCQ